MSIYNKLTIKYKMNMNNTKQVNSHPKLKYEYTRN